MNPNNYGDKILSFFDHLRPSGHFSTMLNTNNPPLIDVVFGQSHIPIFLIHIIYEKIRKLLTVFHVDSDEHILRDQNKPRSKSKDHWQFPKD